MFCSQPTVRKVSWPFGSLYYKPFHNLFLLQLAAKVAVCVLGTKCPQQPAEGVASGHLVPAALPAAFSLNFVTKQVMKWLVGLPNRVRIFAFFNKDELMDIVPDNGMTELQAVGQLTSGQYIFGEDNILVFGRKK